MQQHKSIQSYASLPMYDWPEETTNTDLLWKNVRQVLIAAGLKAPSTLDRTSGAMQQWKSPTLVFSQTCGLPYLEHLEEHVTLLGTPNYDIEGCRDAEYSSRLIVNRQNSRKLLENYQDSRLVVNGYDSQSGCNAVRLSLASQRLPSPFFGTVIQSGSHRQSALDVAANSADIAALDPLSWELFKRHEPQAAQALAVIGETPYTPGLPYICANQVAKEHDLEAIQQNLLKQLSSLPATIKISTCINGMTICDNETYQFIRRLQHEADLLGHDYLAPTQAH